MNTTNYNVTIKLNEQLLGTIPKNKDLYKDFIASKAVDAGLAAEEEIATVQEIEEKGWTGFHQDEDGPFLYDYAVKGHLKESARTLKQFGALKQLQDKFTRYVFVTPRKIRLPEVAGYNERPLRALTAQGPRVTLVRSDYVDAGTEITFGVTIIEVGGIKLACLKEVLAYGQFLGLGQWRSGGWGRFEVVSIDEA
jgi:hypothetical protein